MMNSWLKNILWLAFIIVIIIAMGFVNSSKQEKTIGLPKVTIKVYEDQLFLNEADILQKLIDKKLISEIHTYSNIDFAKIEFFLMGLSEVKQVDVHTKVSGNWQINIELRKPIARLFNLNGSSCYIDEEGKLMPLSNNYSAHVLTINGYVNETDMNKSVKDVINNDSLKTIEILDDLFNISNYVCSDKFFSSQITHIYVNSENEFELIPRVGKQRILFGDSEQLVGKFKKLKIFYKEGIANSGWGIYDTINVKYKNQIVCSKK